MMKTVTNWFLRRMIMVYLLFSLGALTTGTAFAQTNRTIPAGSGTLSYTISTNSTGCGGVTESLHVYNNFSYKDPSGTNWPFSGDSVTASPGNANCDGYVDPYPLVLQAGSSIVDFYGTQAGGNGSATVTPTNVTGFINPKFVIVGVTYAPPGPSSNVTYTNSTFVGNTTTTTGSFTNDNSLTVSVTNGIGAWTPGSNGFGVKITGTDSTDYIQGSNTSSTVTISKQTSVSDKTNGTGNAFAPVNHDYDTIWLWLNPLMIYTINPNDPSFLQWNGYGFDNNDVNGMDIFGVEVGWLNGDFGVNSSIQTVLARGWVSSNEPGMIWPAGEGPGLTSTDIANILRADPFTSGSYVLPSPLPSTSADGRFTQIPYPPNPVNYTQAGLGNGGGTTTMYNAVYTNTSSVGQGSSYTFKEAFGTEEQFAGGTFLNHFSVDVKQTDTLTWTNSWQNTLTTTTTLTDALSVTGPGCPQTSPPCVPAYSGPGEFIVYQDNLYGTFMFYPGN
jgi:hypothetical protein